MRSATLIAWIGLGALPTSLIPSSRFKTVLPDEMQIFCCFSSWWGNHGFAFIQVFLTLCTVTSNRLGAQPVSEEKNLPLNNSKAALPTDQLLCLSPTACWVCVLEPYTYQIFSQFQCARSPCHALPGFPLHSQLDNGGLMHQASEIQISYLLSISCSTVITCNLPLNLSPITKKQLPFLLFPS